MKLKERLGSILMTVGLGLAVAALVLQIVLLSGGANAVLILTLGPFGLTLTAVGFRRRVLFALDHMSPVPGYLPAPVDGRLESS